MQCLAGALLGVNQLQPLSFPEMNINDPASDCQALNLARYMLVSLESSRGL